MKDEDAIYRLAGPQRAHNAATSPLVFDNPHSGTRLPAHFKFSCDAGLLNHVSDLHMEKVLGAVARSGQVPVLEALIHRACIDLNRFADEFDPAELRGPWSGPARKTGNTANGFGLFMRDLHHNGQLSRVYNDAARPDAAELQRRIDQYHQPYYQALDQLLNRAHQANGYCVHINMHSMPRPRHCNSDIILGDLFGTACAPALTAFAQSYFTQLGYKVTLNRPYSGGALIKHSHAPDKGRHALQIEIARDLYMDSRSLTYLPNKAQGIKQALSDFAHALENFCHDHAAQLQPKKPRPPHPAP